MVKILVIDPPSGWMYGFPKPAPKDLGSDKLNKWLVENGYPQKEIDVFKGKVPCRYWEAEEGEW